jgi:CheY-like chemotaxis protein
MHALGYEVCDLATNGQQAFLLAMSDQPDVVLMDVCLEGGREGIEVTRRLREVCDAAIIFVTALTALPSSASMNVYQERQYCPSRFIVTGSPTPYRRSHSISTDGRQGGATEAVIAKAGYAGGHH